MWNTDTSRYVYLLREKQENKELKWNIDKKGRNVIKYAVLINEKINDREIAKDLIKYIAPSFYLDKEKNTAIIKAKAKKNQNDKIKIDVVDSDDELI